MSRSSRLSVEYNPTLAEPALRLLRDYDITMLSATWWWEDGSWHVPRRQLNDVMLLAPVLGSIEVILPDRTVQVPAGSVLLAPEGLTHELRCSAGCDALEQVSIHCHITATWRPPLLPLFLSPVQPLAHATAWHERLRRLVVLMNDQPLGQHYGQLLIKELLVEWILAGVELVPPREQVDPRIVRALKRIHADYADDLTVTELAREAHLSSVQFRKLFQRHLHQPPKQYILSHRLKLAAQLLRTGGLTVQQIAFATGFNSEAYFHRCFHRTHACTPLDYRTGRGRTL